MPCFNFHSPNPNPVLYTFLFLLLHTDDDSAERQRIDIADTDASELVSWRWYGINEFHYLNHEIKIGC